MPIRRRRCSAMRDSAILYREALTAQTQKRQFRLTAPFFQFNAAGASLRSRASKTLRVRGSTGTPCHFSFSQQLRSSQVGRHRPHKPLTSGFDSRLRYHFSFSGRSIIQEVTCLAHRRARSKAAAVHHLSNRGKVENLGSLISSSIVVQLHVPQPI